MKLEVSKNVQFTRLLKADGRLREFNFRKLGGLHNGMFGVDVVNDRGDRIIFKLVKENADWKIFDRDVPAWVTAAAAELHEILEETLNRINPEENKIVINE